MQDALKLYGNIRHDKERDEDKIASQGKGNEIIIYIENESLNPFSLGINHRQNP